MKDILKIVFVGHVDHGKSTVIGRILFDTKVVADDRVQKVKDTCEKQGKEFEYAFLLDALEEEQKQGITIDTTKIHFKTDRREFTIIDAPGHKEFLKNMISGASKADTAVVIIDAKDGVKEQSKRHGYILSILGLNRVIVLINKMDLVKYSEDRFVQLKKEYGDFLKLLNVKVEAFVPVSASLGENITKRSAKMKWYKGPAFIDVINDFKVAYDSREQVLRFPIQDVYKFDDKRIIAGRIESGEIKVGDRVRFAPTDKESIVSSIEKWHASTVKKASIGESVGITIKDELFVDRGQIICHPKSQPACGNIFSATIFWISKKPLKMGEEYILRLTTTEVRAEIHIIKKVLNSSTLEVIRDRNDVRQNEVAEVIIKTDKDIAFDYFNNIPATGRFVFVENHGVAGGGIIIETKELENRHIKPAVLSLISPTKSLVSLEERMRKYGHKSKVIWITGIPGSGRNSIAKGLEQKLFENEYQVYLLSGSNIRLGLSSDLDYSESSRHEQARRISEVAKLFLDAGITVIVSSVSPYKADREYARKLIGNDNFIEVCIECSLAVCRKRSPHGLLKNTDNVSGFGAPYEKSPSPEVYLNTTKPSLVESIDEAYKKIKKFLI